MWRKARIILIVSIVLSTMCLIVLIFMNSREKTVIDTTYAALDVPGAVMGKVRYSRYSGEGDGRLKWELEADSAISYDDAKMVELDGVRLIFYSEDGNSYVMKSSKGVYNESDGKIDVSGGVTLVSDDGYSLSADAMSYLIRSRQVVSASRVVIDSGSMNVRGLGLEMDIDGGRFSVLHDVTTVFKDAII